MSESRELLDEGLRHEKAGVTDRALDCYRSAFDATSNPSERSEAWRRQAHVHRVRCEWDAALAVAREAAAIAEAAKQDNLARFDGLCTSILGHHGLLQ